MDLGSEKLHVHQVHTNHRQVQVTKDQETVLLVLLAITVPWDQRNSTFVLQATTAQQVAVCQRNVEQELTTLKLEELTLANV